jgi:hypothetical protein
MSIYARSAEIIRRVRLEMPVQITLPDPISGVDFVLSRDNVLSLLIIDTGNIFLEGQTVSAFFAEMGRAQRGCERACARAEVEFRIWKAQMVRSYKASAEASGKRGTDKDAEASYRVHPDYRDHANLPGYYRAAGNLFLDIKEGFAIKARMITSQARAQGEHEHVTTAEVETDARASAESVERLEELAAEVFAVSQRAATVPTPKAVEEDEDEVEPWDEDEEDDEDEDEDELPPAPPPPPKRAPKKTTKKATKKTTKRAPRKRSN